MTRKKEYRVLKVCKSVYRRLLLCKIMESNTHITKNLHDENLLWIIIILVILIDLHPFVLSPLVLRFFLCAFVTAPFILRFLDAVPHFSFWAHFLYFFLWFFCLSTRFVSILILESSTIFHLVSEFLTSPFSDAVMWTIT